MMQRSRPVQRAIPRPRSPAPQPTFTDLGRAIAANLARLVRLEIRLVLVSVQEVAVAAGRGTALMLAGTLVGTAGLLLLLYGLGALIALVLPEWLVAFLGAAMLLAAAIPVSWRSWRALTGS